MLFSIEMYADTSLSVQDAAWVVVNMSLYTHIGIILLIPLTNYSHIISAQRPRRYPQHPEYTNSLTQHTISVYSVPDATEYIVSPKTSYGST